MDGNGASSPSEDGEDSSAATVEADDLTNVVRNLRKRQGERYNAALINNSTTRAFLDAGMRLVSRAFSSEGAEERKSDNKRGLPGVEKIMTRANIVKEAAQIDPSASEGKFRGRWEFLPDYLEDLVRFGLRSERWSPHLSVVERFSERMAIDPDLAGLAKEVAREDLQAVRKSPAAMRFRFYVAAFAERDEDYKSSLESAQSGVIERWKALYARLLTDRGLQLRPGLDLEDVTRILHATMEGLSLQLVTVSDEDNDRVDHDALLWTAGLAMIAACIDRPGDGRRLEELVDALRSGSSSL